MKYLKETAEKQIGKKLDSVVLGRPVHFQDFAPDSDAKAEAVLRKIAVNAGFKEISFQYEPLAAAFAHETRLRHEQLACVIDIGGGTSDFSVIRLSPQKRNSQNRKKTSLLMLEYVSAVMTLTGTCLSGDLCRGWDTVRC